MSTKTLRKRIALVAVSALGAGLLSVVAVPSANAAVASRDLVASATAASATNYGILSKTDSSATATTYEMLVNGQADFTGTAAQLAVTVADNVKYTITQGSGVITYVTDTAGNTGITGSLASDGQSVTWAGPDGTKIVAGTHFIFKPTAAGKTVILYTKKVGDVVSTVETITIIAVPTAAASATEVLSVANSFFSRVSSATGTVTTNVDAVTTSVDNGSCAYIAFDLKDAYYGNVSVGAIVATSSSTDASVTFDLAAAAATSSTTAVMANAGSANYVAVCQATANKAATTTVSVSYNGTVVGSRTVVIVGQLAKLAVSATAAAGLSIAPRSSSSGTHFYVLGYDAAGNRVATSGTPAVDTAGLTTVVSNVTVSGALAVADSPGKSGFISCSATDSGSSDVRVKHVDNLGATIYSNTFKAQCGGTTPYSVKASLDKASYVPGDVATLTLTATDSQGKAVADTTTTGADYSVAASNMTAVTAPSTADTFTWGTKTYKFIVGSTEGSYVMAVSMPAYAAAGVTDQTIAFAIKASSTTIQLADVLKAIVSLIASINKQIAALQKALLKK
jgi:hypothetical protein